MDAGCPQAEKLPSLDSVASQSHGHLRACRLDSPTVAKAVPVQVRDAHLQFMVSVATMLREDMNLPKNSRLMQNDRELEILVPATVPQEERHDVTTLYHQLDLGQLQNKFGLKGFNWTLFMQSVLPSVKIKLLADEEVVVYGIPYLQDLENIISVCSARAMQNYLVLDRITSLSQRFKDAPANYRRVTTFTSFMTLGPCCGRSTEVHTGVEARGQASEAPALLGGYKAYKLCIQGATLSPGASFLAPSLLQPQQPMARTGLRTRPLRRPRGGSSRHEGPVHPQVRELIDRVQAAFMDTLDELGWVDEVSEKAQEKLNFLEDLYFENSLQNLKASAHRSLKRLREKVDQNLKEQPQALNFRGIRVVIGHEITHGFDDNGRNFDMDGNMHDWRSRRSAWRFWRQSECMIYQYGNYSWDLAEKQDTRASTAPGPSPALAPARARDRAQAHCPGWLRLIPSIAHRVLGSLQNLTAFSDAFHCAQGTPMHTHRAGAVAPQDCPEHKMTYNLQGTRLATTKR
ncbi:hypothetical protein MC885_009191 [Smutsia gigantea]|nr:hypothetical protein MC885_009191 [Smutsia gigantea]